MPGSHADDHDRDKLARWHRDMSSSPPNSPSRLQAPGYRLQSETRSPKSVARGGVRGDFPVYAVFLVSANDRAAHDIFRQFRTSFEARNAGFEHLVIFGQHGISSTVLGLLAALGLPDHATPLLAVFASTSATTVYTLPLAGAGEDAEGPWRETLARVEDAADRGEKALDPASLPGFTVRRLKDGPLLEVAGQLLAAS